MKEPESTSESSHQKIKTPQVEKEEEAKTKLGTMETEASTTENNGSPLKKIIAVASIATGVQFGWALQLSLLTPYVQLLGIPHKWSSLIWLCGPISDLIVQPIAGYYSDRCTSPFGRRKPFILAGTVLVAFAVILIGYAADFGHILGDPESNQNQNQNQNQTIKPRAIGLFVLGFWVLDVANNTLQGPCRALLADLSGNDHKKTRMANAFFSFFLGIGNILGYAAGSLSKIYYIFRFTKTSACDVYCANLKTCFFLSITLLILLTILALYTVKEEPLKKEEREIDSVTTNDGNFFIGIFNAFIKLEKPMWILLLVTCLNWIGWFPFLLFDTDWMGREVYGGKASGGTAEEVRVYNNGVHAGALGLMLNAVVLMVMSLGIETVGRWVGGVKRLWGIVNFVLAVCLGMTLVVSKVARANFKTVDGDDGGVRILAPTVGVKAGALAIFAVLGIPQAVSCVSYDVMCCLFC